LKVRVGKFMQCSEMSQADWRASPIWELQWRFDAEYYARPIEEPAKVTRELLTRRSIVILVRCEQFDRYAIARVRSMHHLEDISVFWRGGWQPVERLSVAKSPFYVVAIPPFGRETDVRFVWKTKRSPFATRAR
jgi:hypothetical protein